MLDELIAYQLLRVLEPGALELSLREPKTASKNGIVSTGIGNSGWSERATKATGRRGSTMPWSQKIAW